MIAPLTHPGRHLPPPIFMSLLLCSALPAAAVERNWLTDTAFLRSFITSVPSFHILLINHNINFYKAIFGSFQCLGICQLVPLIQGHWTIGWKEILAIIIAADHFIDEEINFSLQWLFKASWMVTVDQRVQIKIFKSVCFKDNLDGLILNSWTVLHCVSEPHFLYPFFCYRTCELCPASGYHKQGHYEHSRTCAPRTCVMVGHLLGTCPRVV